MSHFYVAAVALAVGYLVGTWITLREEDKRHAEWVRRIREEMGR